MSLVGNLGAYTILEQGLVSDRGEVGSVSLARISASAFSLTRIPPALGRFLTEADERAGAPPVVVLGSGTWQTLLGGDPDVVGRTVQLGGTATTVVGVMPEGYAFPEAQNAWVPLGVEAGDADPGASRRAAVFGRLAPGATLDAVQAELDVAGRRAAADFPEVYARLSPGVRAFADRAPPGLRLVILSGARLFFVFLLVVVSANVAALVFARTVLREHEIAVRAALGASRRRIVLQLFAEALVLVGGATFIGLLVAWLALGRIGRLFFAVQQQPQLPFWWNDALSPSTIGYAIVLAFVGAVMIGVVPALKATRGPVRLGQLSTGAKGSLRFGGVWTVVIVLQIALSVAFLPLAVSRAASATCGAGLLDPYQCGDFAAAFPADEYLTARLGCDATVPPRTPEEQAEFFEGSRRLFEAVRDRVAADPGVRGAALASGLSAMNHVGVPVELASDGPEASPGGRARILLVDPSYLELMDATLVAGRSLAPADFASGAGAVVVNQAFVEVVLGGRNPVGARLRFPERDRGSEASLVEVLAGGAVDVVGVVRNPGIDTFGPGTHPTIYAPLDLAPVSPREAGFVGMPQPPAAQLFVRLAPNADPPAGRLYEVVSQIDPTLRVADVGTAADAWGPVHAGGRVGAAVVVALGATVLMLAMAGVYALMSFTVSQRRREIAIRTAVGAPRGRILRTVFGKAALQIAAGVSLGGLMAAPALRNDVADDGLRSLVVVAALLIGAGLAACLVPVRRALGIEPAAAIKAE